MNEKLNSAYRYRLRKRGWIVHIYDEFGFRVLVIAEKDGQRITGNTTEDVYRKVIALKKPSP